MGHRRGIAPEDCAPGFVAAYTGAGWVCEEPHPVKPACHEGFTARWVGTHFVCVPKGRQMQGFGANPHPHDQAFQGGIFTDQPGRYGYQQGPLESYQDGSLGATPPPGARLGLPPIPSIWPTTKPNPPVREVSGVLGAIAKAFMPPALRAAPPGGCVWGKDPRTQLVNRCRPWSPGLVVGTIPPGVRCVKTPAGCVPEQQSGVGALPEPLATIFRFMPYVGGAVGVYHGYQRNKGSVPWAIGWGAFGMWLWFLALPLAFVQGVGQPAGK